jgi:hypothetical protein
VSAATPHPGQARHDRAGDHSERRDGGSLRCLQLRLLQADRRGEIERLTLKDVEEDLIYNAYSDINGVKHGAIGTVFGANESTVFDVAGTVTTVGFSLVGTTVPGWDVGQVYTGGDRVILNGVVYVAHFGLARRPASPRRVL